MPWRKKLDLETRNILEREIKETAKHKKAYNIADNPQIAQLWIALSNLSKRISQIESKLKKKSKSMEKTFKKF